MNFRSQWAFNQHTVILGSKGGHRRIKNSQFSLMSWGGPVEYVGILHSLALLPYPGPRNLCGLCGSDRCAR